MKPHDLKHLLGGYATGTLTPEEHKALFDAALEDQELFDALAREQALKEVLDEPAVRRELIAELALRPGWRERLAAWSRPAYPIAAVSAMAAVAAVAVIYIVRDAGPSTRHETQVAELRGPIEPAPKLEVREPASLPKAPAQSRRPPARPASRALALRPKAETLPAPEPPAASAVETANVAEAVAPRAAAAPQASFRKSIVASEDRQLSEVPAIQARELFYMPTMSASSGVVGGVPGAQMMGARSPQPSAAMFVSAAPPLGVRYSGSRSGASVNLVIEANTDSVVYLFRRAAAGEWLPIAAGGMSLKAHTAATAPAFAPDAAALDPGAILVLSRRALPQLAQAGAALAASIAELRGRAGASRWMSQTADASTFVVAPLTQPSDVIVVPVTLP